MPVVLIALSCAVLALGPARAHAQSGVEGEVEGESGSESESESAHLLEAPADPGAGLVAGVADTRLAMVDDGIDEIFAAWASMRLFTGPTVHGSSAAMLHTELGVNFGIARDARARLDWGFAYTASHMVGIFSSPPAADEPYDAYVDRLEAQNPTLTFEWAPIIGSTRFAFGLGIAAPTAGGENVPSTVDAQPAWEASSVTHELMLAAAGGLAPWRYRRERLGLFIPLSFWFPIDRMTIAIEGAAAIAAPVTGAGPVPVTGDLQADVQIAGDLIPEVRLGARFGIALLGIGANRAPGTIVQPSATGFVRVRIDPGFLVASILADLGGHYGLSGTGGVWAITLGGGAAIP